MAPMRLAISETVEVLDVSKYPWRTLEVVAGELWTLGFCATKYPPLICVNEPGLSNSVNCKFPLMLAPWLTWPVGEMETALESCRLSIIGPCEPWTGYPSLVTNCPCELI